MLKSINVVVASILSLGLMVSVGVNYYLIGSINVMKIEATYLQTANGLLKDQVADYGIRIASTKTYEQGLSDGITRSETDSYVDGYHAAINQTFQDNLFEYNEKLRLTKKNIDRQSSEAKPATFDASQN